MKVEKRVLFLPENSRKVEKGVVFGRPLTCFLRGKSLFFFIYLCFLYNYMLFKVCATLYISYIKWSKSNNPHPHPLLFVPSYALATLRSLPKKSVFYKNRGVFRPQNLSVLTKKGLVFSPKISEKGVFFILENADTSYYTH